MKYCFVILSLKELNINLQTISTNDVIRKEKNTSVSIENNERKYFCQHLKIAFILRFRSGSLYSFQV